MSKHRREYDKNVLNAIMKLPWPLLNNKSVKVFVRANARNEDGFVHIAGKCHLMKVRDIELIPSTLLKPYKITLPFIYFSCKDNKLITKSQLNSIFIRYFCYFFIRHTMVSTCQTTHNAT